MTRLLVFGGRDYRDIRRVQEVLDAAIERLGLTVVVHGAAPGADSLAAEWAASRGMPDDPYPADWFDLSHPNARIKRRRDGLKYDASAGVRRNQKMLDEGRPDVAIGFPGGKGTRDMLSRCRAAEIPVYLIDWKG